jgi:hypothetical protein
MPLLPFRYPCSWIARQTRVFIGSMWALSTFWSVLPFMLKQLNITSHMNWYAYLILYGFYGFPIIQILSMNLAILVTALATKTKSSGEKWVSHKSQQSYICVCQLYVL